MILRLLGGRNKKTERERVNERRENRNKGKGKSSSSALHLPHVRSARLRSYPLEYAQNKHAVRAGVLLALQFPSLQATFFLSSGKFDKIHFFYQHLSLNKLSNFSSAIAAEIWQTGGEGDRGERSVHL